MNEHQRTFTLIELMVTIAIIGLLATVVTVAVVERLPLARVETVKTDFQQIRTALNLFRVDHSRLPRDLEELVHPPQGTRKTASFYLETLPKDPWGRAYDYEQRGARAEITSLGADGAPGGEDEDADLLASALLAR